MTAIDLSVDPPDVERLEVVLVVGPSLAGTTSLVRVLCDRMPGHTFVEPGELTAAQAPAAVVVTVSATAPLTESDCALIDSATEHTDVVVAVVSKIDTHRKWRKVLAADQASLAQRAPRYVGVPWVGAAAAPDLGESRTDELVVLLRQRFSDPDVARRNRLRAWESRLQSSIGRYRTDGAGADRVRLLHQERDGVLAGRRLSNSERALALRGQLKQARVELGHEARNRAAAMRRELAGDAAQLTRRGIGTFESHVRTRARDAGVEVEQRISDRLVQLAVGLQLPSPQPAGSPRTPELSAPPLTARRQETQLMMILGAGFGLGAALVVTRLFAGIAQGVTVAGLVVGGLVGLALTVWVVGLRGLLHDRGVLDRWVGDVVNVVRSDMEERVATRVLAAETALCSELARRDAREGAEAAGRIAEIDAELRAHAVQTARAAKVRDRRLPPLRKALDAVRAELYGPDDPKTRSAESIHRPDGLSESFL